MNPDPEKDVLGENLKRALGACDDHVDRSYEEFQRRLQAAAPRRRIGAGPLTSAASLLVCAGILVAILTTGGSPAGPVAAGLQDKKKPTEAPPPSAQEESLVAQIALQEKLLEKTTDEQERALIQATIKTLRGELLRIRDAAAAKVEKKSAPQPLDEAGRLVVLAEMQLKTKKWDGALADARKAVELAPDRARAHLIVGRACQLLKQMDEADKAFARALELDPRLADQIQEFRTPPPPKGKPDPTADRAAKLRADQEGVYLKIKMSKDPDEQARLEIRAKEIGQELKLLEQGSKKEINIKEVEMKLQKNPEDVEALVARAKWNIDRGVPALALGDLDRAITFKPDFAPAYLARGIAHAMANNPEKGAKDVQRGADLDPSAKKEIEYAWGTLKKTGQGQKESVRSPKEIEQQIAGLKERLDELKAMETNADLSADERAKAGKEAARVQSEIEKLKASAPAEKKK